MRAESAIMLNVWSSPPGLVNYWITHNPTNDIRIARRASVERECEAQPGVKGCLVTVSLKHPTTRHLADLRPSQFLEHADTPLFLRATSCLGADENQLGGVRRVTCRIGHGDLAAKRGAQHDRALDAKYVAEGAYVVAPLCERPCVPWPGLTETVASVIEVDDLCTIRQARVRRLVN